MNGGIQDWIKDVRGIKVMFRIYTANFNSMDGGQTVRKLNSFFLIRDGRRLQLGASLIVAHNPSSMSSMEKSTKGLGEVICRIDLSWDVLQNDVTLLLPILDSKVSDIDVSCPSRWSSGVDNMYGRLVIFIDNSRLLLAEA